jgi:hypothetical protein
MRLNRPSSSTTVVVAIVVLSLSLVVGLLIWFFMTRKSTSSPDTGPVEIPSPGGSPDSPSPNPSECLENYNSEDCFSVDLSGTTYTDYILTLKWSITNQPQETITSVKALLFYDNDTKNFNIDLQNIRVGQTEILISDLTPLREVLFNVKISVNGVIRFNSNPYSFAFNRVPIIDSYNSTNISLRNGGNFTRTSLNLLITRFSYFSLNGTRKATHRVTCHNCPRGDRFLSVTDTPSSSSPVGFVPSSVNEQILIPFVNGDYLEFRFGNVRKFAKIIDGITFDSSEFWINFIDDTGNFRQDTSDIQIINTADISFGNTDQLVLSAPSVAPISDLLGDWVYVINGIERARIRITQNSSDSNKIDVEYATVEFHPPIYSTITWSATPSGNFYIGQIGSNPIGVDERIQKLGPRTLQYLKARDLFPMTFFKASTQNLPTFFTIWP